MNRVSLGRALALLVLAVAVLNTTSALSMPVQERRVGTPVVLLWLVLLLAHAGSYRFGELVRDRLGLRGYVALQAALVFTIAVARAPGPVAIAIFMAWTAELVLLAGARWGTIRITLGAIALYVIAALLTSSVYFATTAGLMLAVTGLVAHAIAALLQRSAPVTAVPPPIPAEPHPNGAPNELSAREAEVLRELVKGARNSEIADKLGISERTVKAHLGNIYQKLGVTSRSAAVATAMRRGLPP